MIKRKEFNGYHMFLLALGMAFACFLPFLLRDKGFFVYFGDYNSQQLPFYTKLHDAVRSGTFFWDLKTDLGSSIYTSYSFYLLGSPFFWLTVLFPKGAIPYLLPILMSVKIAIASLGGYLYCRGYVKSPKSACIGGLLYGFSGFVTVSLVFNHFAEVIAFFPFYLLAAQKLAEEKKYGYFACMTAFMAVLNYFFFVGEVVFLILWFLVRYVSDRKVPGREKLHCGVRLGVEGLLGVMVSAFFLYPSLLAVAGNSRVSRTIFEEGPFFYQDVKTYFALLKGMFLPPDIINAGTLFATDEGTTASVSLFLPLFAMSGVTAYFIQKKGWDFPKKICLLCLLLALIPMGNALFTMENATYYARWFFMPLLIMASMTAVAVEEFDRSAFSKGTLFFGIMVVLFFLTDVITKQPSVEADGLFAVNNRSDYELEVAVAVGSFVVLVYLVFVLGKDKKKKYIRAFLIGTVFCCVCTMLLHIHMGCAKMTDSGRSLFQKQTFGEASVTAPGEQEFWRMETDASVCNYGMIHDMPSVSAFLSTVSGSVMDFYEFAGIKRSVESRIPYNRPGIRNLLSVRYFLQNEKCTDDYEFVSDGLLMGYEKAGEKNGYTIYENDNYLHMGAVFDRYMKYSEYEKLSETEKDLVLVYAPVITDDEMENLSNFPGMKELTAEEFKKEAEKEDGFAVQCRLMNEGAAEYFVYSDTKLEMKYSDGNGGLAFLSVPYSEGFTAYIDGNETDILVVDGGLMAVKLPKETHTVTLEYREPGLTEGIVVSILGVLLLAAWIVKHRLSIYVH